MTQPKALVQRLPSVPRRYPTRDTLCRFIIGGLVGVIVMVVVCAVVGVMTGETAAPLLLNFTAGGFIYVATVDVLPQLLRECSAWQSVRCAVVHAHDAPTLTHRAVCAGQGDPCHVHRHRAHARRDGLRVSTVGLGVTGWSMGRAVTFDS